MDNLSNKTNNESATCKKIGKVLLFLAFIMGTIVCGVASSNTGMVHALTYQNNVPVEFTFNPTLSIDLSSADLIISDLSPGSSSDSNIITVSVSTNAAHGYNLSATVGSKGGTTALTNPNTSATFTNLATTAGAASTLSNIPDNYWGYSYSIDNGTSWISGDVDSSASGYAGLPLDNNDDANEKGKGGVALQNTTDSTGVAPIKFKIGAKASASQPSGEYTNTINFYAVTNPKPVPPTIPCTAANKICYSANSLGPTEGTMGEQDANANTSIDLLASNFSRDGYGFAGWNTQPDYSGTFYGPQETITTPSDMSAGLPLYAVWVESAGSMQTDVASVCSSLTTAPTNGTANLSSVSALTDQRDNETYAIAKLADGQCWMIENLRLEAEYTRSAEHQALAQGYGTSSTYGNFSGLANAENANFTGDTNSDTAATEPNSLYYAGTQPGTASINISQTNYAGFRMPRYNSDNHQATSVNRPQNPTSNDTENSTTKSSMYSYGNYYTWAAAMANTGYYDTTTTDENGYTPSEAENTSLCPKGWKLPYGRNSGKGATSGGFSNLDIALGGTGANQSTAEASNRWRNFPNNFLYSGYFNGSSASDRGSRGVYWSSTASNYGASYDLYFLSSRVRPGTIISNKYIGLSIRCIAGS